MKFSQSIQGQVLSVAALAALAGCAGSPQAVPQTAAQSARQAITGTPSRLSPYGSLGARPDLGHSWMAADAKAQDLLYVSDAYQYDIYVYSYRQGVLEGKITGLNYPGGECVDKHGNVFVTNTFGQDIYEYAHGGTTPTATLQDSGYQPIGCAIDPTTGDLAVTNYATSGSGPGDIVIYKGAKGLPQGNYSEATVSQYWYCAYDSNGNLFVNAVSTRGIKLYELANGHNSLTEIAIHKRLGFQGVGGLEWVGDQLAISDEDAGSVIKRFTISGRMGTQVGSTALGGSCKVFQFTIRGSKLIGPNYCSGQVIFWNYPAGGTGTKTLSGMTEPVGSAISPVH